MKLKNILKNILKINKMKKFRMNSLKNKILIKGIIDIMIPASDDQSLPKASDAINVNKFLSKILQDKDLVKKLDLIIFNLKDKKLDNLELGKLIAKSKKIENNIDKILIRSYFSSRLVQKQLNKKTIKNLHKKKSKNKDNYSLLKLVKNSSLRYKHI